MHYILEKVATNSTQRLAYSLPDYIEDADDIRELINTIESNSELKLMVLGDSSRKSFSDAKAKDVWFHLDTTPIGKKLMAQYPDIVNYRIASVSTMGEPELFQNPKEGQNDIYIYDKWGNSNGIKIPNGEMPSFKEYFFNSQKWNPSFLRGATAKDKIF
jgi:hypothetical protein